MTFTPLTHDNVPAEDWDYEGIFDLYGEEIGMTKHIDDAQFICHRVNAYDDLVEALKLIASFNSSDVANFFGQNVSGERDTMQEIADKALAKLEANPPEKDA